MHNGPTYVPGWRLGLAAALATAITSPACAGHNNPTRTATANASAKVVSGLSSSTTATLAFGSFGVNGNHDCDLLVDPKASTATVSGDSQCSAVTGAHPQSISVGSGLANQAYTIRIGVFPTLPTGLVLVKYTIWVKNIGNTPLTVTANSTVSLSPSLDGSGNDTIRIGGEVTYNNRTFSNVSLTVPVTVSYN